MSSAFDLFDNLVNAREVNTLLLYYNKLNENLFLNECVKSFSYFLKLKKLIQKSKQILKYNKISSIIQKLEKRSQLKCYSGRPLNGQRCLVIGGGISGLRVAIELLLLGANVICVEKRDTFSRNNVIHLWPNVISDLRLLAAKRFYGRFCVGSIDHVSIREIQLILLKIALIFGLKFCPNITFDKLCPKLSQNEECSGDTCCCHSHGIGDGAVAHFLDSQTNEEVLELNSTFFDIIVGSDGKRNTLFNDFPRKEFRGKLAIAITANFINKRTEAEVSVSEISGVSYIYAQKWFKQLSHETGIQLENICYYRDETHYFVMTATKQSLLMRGVLIQDLNETHLLLDEKNINRTQLLSYALDSAQWTSGLRELEFALNAMNSPDVALFDFTSVYAARNASRAKKVRINRCFIDFSEEKYVLMLLTGDSLLEPFWPTGSGAGRGFLSALDAAYTALQWTEKVVKSGEKGENLLELMLDVICERESIYRLLAQTTPENINSKEFSLFPQNRYQNWNQNSKFEIKPQVRHLIGLNSQPITDQQSMAAKRARRATVAVTTRDFNDSQSANKEREELEFELIKRDLELKRLTEESRDSKMRQKASWLLGEGSGEESKVNNEEKKVKKKENIIIRAKQLEEKIKEKTFSPKLSKVGKIEENDWNFKVWNKNQLFSEKSPKLEKKSVLENSRAILESRKVQIEEKLNDNKKEEKHINKTRDKQWIERMSEELNQRISSGKVLELKKEEEEPEIVSRMPCCVRCGLEVSLMDRISVLGDILHRSCLRCSKCGISLRLNEFRNELKFLCVFCLKTNSKLILNKNLLEKKENFLREIQKIDFREKTEIQTKKALNSSSSEELTFSSEFTSDSDEWQTTDEEEEDKEERVQIDSKSVPPVLSRPKTRHLLAKLFPKN